MQLTFYGAAGTVTGSRYLLEACSKDFLIDCGLFQGAKELRQRNWAPFPFDVSRLEAVVLTHAHIDHSGYLPLLVRQGFRGKIYCTPPTFELCKLLLPDSGYLQEEDARRANTHAYSQHQPALPLYTMLDAEECLAYFHTVPFGHDTELAEGVSFRFERAGHILGAASVTVKAEGRTVLFSGDIGRPHDLVMKAPAKATAADFVVVESTYGDRRHEPGSPVDQVGAIVARTVKRGGSVVIPSFAVGRAQSLIYAMHQLHRSGKISPDVRVYLDSPMAIQASGIMERFMNEHRLSAAECGAAFNDVTFVHTPEESRRLDGDPSPKVIIAASGMATGGRVLHHIKWLGPDPRNTILLAGFQAAETRGDRLRRGERELRIHGEMVPIRAEVAQLNNMSAHADYAEVLEWLGGLQRAPHKVFITHGEEHASAAFAAHLKELHPDWPVEIPVQMQRVVL